MTKGPEESQKHQQFIKGCGNSSQRRLRYLDLSFTSYEHSRDVQAIKHNGLRPHGGYRGVHNHHPPSIISFDKSMEYRDSVKSAAVIRLEEEKLTSEISPQWAVTMANNVINHSGEHPLFTQQYLSPIKDEQGDGFVHPKPRRCKSAGTRTEREYFRMASSLHNYLTATPVPPDALLGRPTRTSVLRAKYRSQSAPTYNAGQDTKEQLHVQASIIDEQRPIPKVTITALNKEVFPQMDGESLHQWITGAKYNRSHWLEKQGGLSSHSMHMFGSDEEKAAEELGVNFPFAHETLIPADKNKIEASVPPSAGTQLATAMNKTALKQQQTNNLSSKTAKRNLINARGRFPSNVASIRQQQNSRENGVIKLPRGKVDIPIRGFLPSRHRSKLSSFKDDFIMAGKRFAIDPLSVSSLTRSEGMLLQGTRFGTPANKLRPHATKNLGDQDPSDLRSNPLYMMDVPETDNAVAKPEERETAEPIKLTENCEESKDSTGKEVAAIPEPVRKVRIIKSATSSRGTENKVEEDKVNESGDGSGKKLGEHTSEVPGEPVTKTAGVDNAAPETSEAISPNEENANQNSTKEDSKDQKVKEEKGIELDNNTTDEDAKDNNTTEVNKKDENTLSSEENEDKNTPPSGEERDKNKPPSDENGDKNTPTENEAPIKEDADTEKLNEKNSENEKQEEKCENSANKGGTKSEGAVEPKELSEEGVDRVSELNNNLEDSIGLEIESSASKLQGEREPVVSGSDNTMFITEIKDTSAATENPVEQVEL